MNYLEIEKVIGREILDSRGNPTVEAEVYLVQESLRLLNSEMVEIVILEKVLKKLLITSIQQLMMF